jgi:ABC-type dipeptide/oligopeptide/nickel transport system permease subunit
VIVAATISVPGYILGEVVLSFLGVGVQEPAHRGATCSIRRAAFAR